MQTLSAYRVLSVLTVIALLLTLTPPLTVAAPAAEGSIVYRVQWGDTLFSISRRFGTTVPAIMTANGLISDYIYAGQQLVIPLGAPPPTVQPPSGFTCKYTVQYRDTIYSIAWRYKVPYYQLMQANNLYYPYITVGMQLNVPCTTPAPDPFPTYVVQPTDNLFRIAIQYKTSIYAIMVVNGLYSAHWIYPGQKLVIPYPNTVEYPPNIPTRVPTPTKSASSSSASSSSSSSAGPTVAPAANISMFNNAFSPTSVIINAGGIVQWKNLDANPHTVTSGTQPTADGKFRSGVLNKDQTFTHKFDTPGTYSYFSETDNGMTGTITVQ